MEDKQWIEALAKLADTDVAPSFILGVAALMALTNLRNSDIATRCRNITDEFLYKLDNVDEKYKEARGTDLREQHDKLLARYTRLSWVFIGLSVSLAAYLAAVILGQVNSTGPLGYLVFCSVGLNVVAVLGLIDEFRRGPETLKLNNLPLWRSRK